MPTEPKILTLSLKKAPFEVMVTGEKAFEVREISFWIMSRLFDKNGQPKEYDAIKFINGYGADKPYFIAQLTNKGRWGWFDMIDGHRCRYSNGFLLEFTGFR